MTALAGVLLGLAIGFAVLSFAFGILLCRSEGRHSQERVAWLKEREMMTRSLSLEPVVSAMKEMLKPPAAVPKSLKRRRTKTPLNRLPREMEV